MAGMTDATLFALVRDFLKTYLPRQRNNSPHTIKAYRTSLEQLFDFVKKNIGLAQITFEILNDGTIPAFLDWLEVSQGCGISTRNHRLKCIRSFYNYAASMEPTAVKKRFSLWNAEGKGCRCPTILSGTFSSNTL
jgi:integrase/recombinase XerD